MSRRLFLYFLVLLGAPVWTYALPPNIILITLDTTRADRMGFLGSKRGLTPNLDQLAREGVVFSRAYAQEPLTTPSHAVMLTGTYPQFSHLQDLGAPLGKDLPYLPDILRRHGYRTAAFVGAYILDPKGLAAPGFDRGFETYNAPFHKRIHGEDRYRSVERRAADVVNNALAWLNKRAPGPFFLWLHFFDAHDPYDPPPPFKARYASEPYDGEIAYTDSEVGRFLTALRQRGLYQGAVIAVMADHGEAFGEHGELRHGVFLYDETIHVPLLFKLPLQGSAGQRVDARVGLVDVAPTLLQVAGAPVPAAMQGESLAGSMKAKKDVAQAAGKPGAGGIGDRPVYSETDYARRAFGWSDLQAWRSGKYLYVQAPKRELYEVSTDPAATHNLASESRAVADTLAGQLEGFRQKTSSAKTARTATDPALAENLRALGYLAADTNQSETDNKEERTDPKDKIEIANLLHQSLIDLEEDRYEDALPRLEQVVKQEPNAATGLLQLGRVLVHLKQYDRALPVLQKAVGKMPDSAMAHYELGLALVKTGQWEAALPEMSAAVTHNPKSAQLHFYLAAVYARLKQVPEAAKEFETTLQLDPKHFDANLLYGRMMFLERNLAGALPKLQKAVLLEPDSRQAHSFLADAYSELGQERNAARERAAAERAKDPGKP
jgi:arylsulfatase A-like enzyme/Flp pilus assembly protein TadD